jgi:ATP-dependent RNA helicase DDX21
MKRLNIHVLHGDIDQRDRERTFKAFKEGSVRCLVATNVAARGVDIPSVDLILQTKPPRTI